MPYSDPIQQREYGRLWIANRRQEYLRKRGNCCERCDGKEDLEFHHRNKNDKLSHKFWSWSRVRLEDELEKCDLLCAKCHLMETSIERCWHNYQHGTLSSYQDGKCRCSLCRSANAKHSQKYKDIKRRVSVSIV